MAFVSSPSSLSSHQQATNSAIDSGVCTSLMTDSWCLVDAFSPVRALPLYLPIDLCSPYLGLSPITLPLAGTLCIWQTYQMSRGVASLFRINSVDAGISFLINKEWKWLLICFAVICTKYVFVNMQYVLLAFFLNFYSKVHFALG